MTKTADYVIWSIEHQAWWPASRMGYVETLALAGRFSHAEAAAIVERANYPPGTCHECMIPLEAFGRTERTVMTPADAEYLRAIMATISFDERNGLIQAYWRDADRADRTPIDVLYLHLGILSGMVDYLLGHPARTE